SGVIENSELVRRIYHDDPDELMPPPDLKKRLSTEDKALLKQWIAEGAKFDQHWSFRPIERPAGDGIDFFVARRLVEENMQASAQADRITLARRVSYDLRGLPPTVTEVDAFVADREDGAYGRLIDRFLKSPHYGEKMAQSWLDLARYGDTNGYHNDSERAMWLYRDYVIDSFNTNKPYDRFIIENMAGDLLPDATDETRVASGFNRCVTFNEEGGADPDEFYVAYAVDRANTTGQVFLGLTVGCAQCHDHKYDPISQKEFYQLYAFFNSVEGEIGAGGRTGYHGKPLPPLLKVSTTEQKQQTAALAQQIPLAEEKLSASIDLFRDDQALVAERQKWEATLGSSPQKKQMPIKNGLVLWLDAGDLKEGEKIESWPDKSGAGRDAIASGGPTATKDGVNGRPAVRLDGKSQFLRTAKGGEKLTGDFTMIAVVKQGAPQHHQMLIMWGEEANGKRRALWRTDKRKFGFNGYHADVVSSADLPADTSQLLMLTKLGNDHLIKLSHDGNSVGEGKVKLQAYGATAITIGANNAGKETAAADIAEVLLFDRALTPDEQQRLGRHLAQKYDLPSAFLEAPADILEIAKLPETARDTNQAEKIHDHFIFNVNAPTRDAINKLEGEIASLKKQKSDSEKNLPTTMVMVEMKNRKPAHVLMRGDFQQPGEQVQPDVPAIFPRLPEDQPRNRLGLAHWLTDPKHPLVARVTVNRLWAQFFGTGLVKTMGDFGTQGGWPSHPHLLDWLAADFIESGWNVKALQKKILLSETYRQSSINRGRFLETDPNNRLLARAPRFRHSAEEIRDTALAVSGLLNRKIGGPSVKPYQPDGYLSSIGKKWKVAQGESLYRRGLYTFWRRTMLYPSFQIFDAPSREFCSVDRPRTNTPLQALVTLNDPTFVEAARVLGEKLAGTNGNVETRLRAAFRNILARAPSAAEIALLKRTHNEQLEHFRTDAKEGSAPLAKTGASPSAEGVDTAEAAAWTVVAQILLNLDETLTRE
ncbi:MAG: DUF1553 domain-containing protein, partial [Akkermansiaceae bacterium]|nr:DUF1553 domain-containing protein [Akkermansiaceae bacterium]